MTSASLELIITPLASSAEADACARMMSATNPWITLGRGFEACRRIMDDPASEVYVGRMDGEIAGFIVLVMQGALVGYLRTVCVAPGFQRQGIGSRLVAFAEERVFRVSPNIWLCVSSFNPDARRLYERLGFRLVGEITDYVIPGASEFLMRKTIGSMKGFQSRG